MIYDLEEKKAFRKWWNGETPERRDHFLKQGTGGYIESRMGLDGKGSGRGWLWLIDEAFVVFMLSDGDCPDYR